MLKKALITGASGFLGSIISDTLRYSNYQIKTLGKKMENNFSIDLSEENLNFEINETFDLVIHAAGKAHSVPKTKIQKQEFFDVNVTGTKNLLKGLENSAIPKAFIFISTVAVYGIGAGSLINEEKPLLASDAYGKSKIKAEQIIQDWCIKNNVICTILRLPLIIGPNPPGNLNAMIKGIQKGYYFNIAGGKAQKSMVLAEDVARIIPVVAEIGGIYNLTDGEHPSFKNLSFSISKQLNKRNPFSLPGFIAKPLALIGDLLGKNAPINSDKLNKILSDLTFDDSKARKFIGWSSKSVLKEFRIK
jgi:nucleoside-diphosphate-sugar epimerase